MLFDLQSVSFAYPGRPPVFNALTRTLPAGLTLLRGPSGCGKSTLLKLLAGFLPPDSGRVLTAAGTPPDAEFQRLRVGFVFQQFNLLPLATVRRNLELAGNLAGLSSQAIATAADHWLAHLDLMALADVRAETLSGGQLQRAALARALLKNPDVLLLDEPTSGLDDAHVARIDALLADWLATGRSAVVSTHDPRLRPARVSAEWRFPLES
ncbi:ABC transporter ATP-binding protein [Rariglobus hedericola]|uniref:ATP-binding cassette domain-containing protein n=1 Tax=Rariglobus hedericola TaxID=2597822 RepID=A0A556QIT7_9BACT|nr:ATP-binding cassette domain-containing protein [Rariglobus hedericola]TSJ76556.1 ATP-binding cassette domain-containing protein [Rariglobus hedericola]